jgi:hypothetical protein
MTKFSYINNNIERIKKEVKMGLISTSTLSHYVIYSRYDYFRRLNNYNGISILLTADSCKICESLVYRVIKEMESEI